MLVVCWVIVVLLINIVLNFGVISVYWFVLAFMVGLIIGSILFVFVDA